MKMHALYSLVFAAAIIVGCSTNDDETTAEIDESDLEDALEESVHLTVYNTSMGITDNDVLKELFAPVLDQYPNVTVELLQDVNIEEMMATGEVPDLIATSNPNIYRFLEMELAGDLSEFFDERGIDVNKFNPAIVEDLELFADIMDTPGAIYGMPVSMNQGILAYNKDIFDQFGVPYPEDGMTWGEITDLAQRVTGTIDGIDYIGIDPGAVITLIRSRSLPIVNEEGEADFSSDEFQNIFSTLEDIYRIPGIVDHEEETYPTGLISLWKNGD